VRFFGTIWSSSKLSNAQLRASEIRNTVPQFRRNPTQTANMKWMQNIVKTKKLRRRKSLSPSPSDSPSRPGSFFSKHKRIAFRKDSGYTEGESVSSLASTEITDSAPWRVGTFCTGIMSHIEILSNLSEHFSILRLPRSFAHSTCFTLTENFRDTAPRPDDWWRDNNTASKESDVEAKNGLEATIFLSGPRGNQRFHNCGLETWHQTREEWKRRTVDTIPPKPTVREYNQLAKGLKKHMNQKSYQLPRRMALSDLIQVYNGIWGGDDY